MARIFALFLLLLVSTPALAQHHHKPHEFKDVEKWIKRFEEPSRKHWQKPQWLITKLGLEAGQAVADIGAAGGYFSFPFADQVGPSGRVLAVEVEPGYFPHLRQKASELGITWLETVKAEYDDPNLFDGSVDMIFICNTYHHIEKRKAYNRKLMAALKPGGRLVIVDFFKNRSIPIGPKPERRVSVSRTRWELQQAGFSVVTHGDWLPYQYVAMGTKPSK